MFQLTAARRRLPAMPPVVIQGRRVSTHSRSKAAAASFMTSLRSGCCFNSQPLEGGCVSSIKPGCPLAMFQLTAARRRLPGRNPPHPRQTGVSTHSRSKAAAVAVHAGLVAVNVSTHSRSKAAADAYRCLVVAVSGFNSQPLEGGCFVIHARHAPPRGFNSQPLEGGCLSLRLRFSNLNMFQLTAARRRLL